MNRQDRIDAAFKEIDDIGCHCDAMHGYNCGIHDAIRRAKSVSSLKSFIATDGSKMEFETVPTLGAVVELFNFVYETEINSRHTVTVEGLTEREEGLTTGASPLNEPEGAGSAGSDTQGAANYEYRD